MNTNHRRPAWSLALAAFALTLIAACAPADLPENPPNKDKGTTGFQGTPRQADGGDGPASYPQDDLPQKGAR